jgi:F-type H+-transporting ATPase subunit epsilon
MSTFRLVIAGVAETKFDGSAVSATFPGSSGVFTILAHHEPIVSTLKEGKISVKTEDGSQKEFDVFAGVVECSGNRAVVLL